MEKQYFNVTFFLVNGVSLKFSYEKEELDALLEDLEDGWSELKIFCNYAGLNCAYVTHFLVEESEKCDLQKKS